MSSIKLIRLFQWISMFFFKRPLLVVVLTKTAPHTASAGHWWTAHYGTDWTSILVGRPSEKTIHVHSGKNHAPGKCSVMHANTKERRNSPITFRGRKSPIILSNYLLPSRSVIDRELKWCPGSCKEMWAWPFLLSAISQLCINWAISIKARVGASDRGMDGGAT